MRKSTVTTTQDSAGSYETEIYDCTNPARIIVGVHGIGVRRWDGENFYKEVAEHYADSIVVLTDLNQAQTDGVLMNPLPVMKSRTEKTINQICDKFPGIPIVIIAHSMGCGISAQLDLQRIAALFFVAPAAGRPSEMLISRYGKDVANGKEITSTIGNKKIYTAEFFNSVKDTDWDTDYNKLVKRYSPIYVYEAGAEEIIGEERFAHRTIPFTSYEITEGAKHNFSGDPLNKLFQSMDAKLVSLALD